MARIQAAVKLDPNRAPEQRAFLSERVEILRESGSQLWVSLEDNQVDGLIAQGMVLTPQPNAGLVELPGSRLRPASETPEPPEGLAAHEPAEGATADYLLQFRAPPDKRWLQEIGNLGARIMHALPPEAVVVRITLDQATSIRALPYVAYLGLFHPAYTVSLSLAGASAPFGASSLRNLQIALPPDDPAGNLTLRFFDAIVPEERRPALEAAGATIVSPAPYGFRVHAPQARLFEILRVPGLLAAELPTVMRTTNDGSTVILGVNQVRSLGAVNFLVNLNGRGEIGGVVDSGFDVGALGGAPVPPELVIPTPFHPDLVTPIRLIRNSATPQNAALLVPDNAPHGTHVAGTICGDGTQSGGQVKGMAPAAALIAQGPLPGDFTVPFEFAFENGASVINNSWRSAFLVGQTNNVYLPTHAEVLDRWCFAHPDVLIVFAAGNDESDTVPAANGVLDAITLGLEQTAKNAFVVGASENLRSNGGFKDSYRSFFGPRYNDPAFNVLAGTPAGAFGMSDDHNHIALFSNRGVVNTSALAPTNRIKPDITAPGTNVLSTRSQFTPPPPLPPLPIPAAFYGPNYDSMLPVGLNRNFYQIFHGTSMATPMVTGCCLLLRQYYRTRFSQLRRPLLLEGTALPGPPPLPQPEFVSAPGIAAHTDGLVFVWCTPAVAAAPKTIRAQRSSRGLAPVDAAPVLLQDNVGNHPAPRVVTHGDDTYVLHRHNDDTMRLSCYDRTLRPVVGFGNAGVVTLAPVSRRDDNVPPDLLVVGDQLVCGFPAGTDDYMVQRFGAATGAPVDAAAVSLLHILNAGPHATLARVGARYTACGVAHPGNYQLQVRQLADDGTLLGAGPTTLVDQAQEMREPCLIENPRLGRHVLVWCDARTVAGGEIHVLFLDADAAPIGAPQRVIAVPAGNRVRRPRILVHPQAGHLLLWEDDTQNAHFDVYAALLDDNGQVDGRLVPDAADPLNRRLVRLSDTPEDTAGFAALVDARGVSVAYQSPDEINSDRLGVYALNLTPLAAFEAQRDALTPLLASGNYTTVDLASVGPSPAVIAAVWTGGSYYLLRLGPLLAVFGPVEWVRLTADALPDPAFGANGVLGGPLTAGLTGLQLLWTGQQLIAAVNDLLGGVTVHLADDHGAPVAGFGVGGAAALQDPSGSLLSVPPQVGFSPVDSRVLVAYASLVGGVQQLRFQRLELTGVRVSAPVNLAAATGTAARNWFQFVPSENRSIAVYQRTVGAVTRVHCRQFQPDGLPLGAEQNLSPAAGEAINGTLARRPTQVNSGDREYAVAWQFRANNAARWEIHFSRLDRTGAPLANPPAPAPPLAVSDVAVIAAGPDWPAANDAIEPQIISTYTHIPWSNPPSPLPVGTSLPAWSPAWGLAFIRQLPDGSRVLFFTALDENGRRAPVPAPPPPAGALAAPVAAPLLQISATNSRVRSFEVVWNGRVFFLYWLEEEGGQLRHRCTAVNRQVSQLAYDLPSAALLRATLVNGATNSASTSLPDVGNGYGWGRLNLRQTLAPAPPVTMHVRDDCSVGPGRSVSYRFTLPSGTALLRVTLNWTDPPGAALVNPLHLTVRAPAIGPNPRPEYRGNLWGAAPAAHLSRPIATPPVAADNHEDTHTFKQVVLANPPPGVYEVEVSAAPFPADPFNQQNLQPFALVFAGSGPEVVFTQPAPPVDMPFY